MHKMQRHTESYCARPILTLFGDRMPELTLDIDHQLGKNHHLDKTRVFVLKSPPLFRLDPSIRHYPSIRQNPSVRQKPKSWFLNLLLTLDLTHELDIDHQLGKSHQLDKNQRVVF